jgi:primosomal protein N' (replication factor Y)
VTEELLSLTKWIADYYYSPWGEVIKSSLPAGINIEAETTVTLTEAGRAAWATRTTRAAASEKIAAQSTKWMVIGRLLDGVETLLKDLAKEYGKPKAAAVIRELERVGYVRVGRRRIEATVKARHQQAVRLLPPSPENAVSNERPLNAAQERLLERLRGLAEPPALAELLGAAEVSLVGRANARKTRLPGGLQPRGAP